MTEHGILKGLVRLFGVACDARQPVFGKEMCQTNCGVSMPLRFGCDPGGDPGAEAYRCLDGAEPHLPRYQRAWTRNAATHPQELRVLHRCAAI